MIALMAASLVVQPAPLHPGVWSSVRTSRESGDYDGLEMRIPAADAGTVAITICEGGCMAPIITRIVRDAVGFTFDVVEPVSDEKGRPDTPSVRHCRARFDGNVLIVLWLGEAVADVLRHRARPLNLPHEIPVLEKSAPRS